jgi:antitoxin component HigA of HigAB toxin-antitoxin module
VPGVAVLDSSTSLLAGCAATKPSPKVVTESLLPEIDVLQVKENSDEALKLAQEAKIEVQTISTKLTEMDNRVSLLSEEIGDVSLAKIEELENKFALLVEAMKDLQVQMRQRSYPPHPSTISTRRLCGLSTPDNMKKLLSYLAL